MWRTIVAIFVVICFVSCEGNSEADEKAATSAAGASLAGYSLLKQYQCFSCHKTNERLTGPSYAEVAARYAGGGEAAIDLLAKKIISGGAGVWGTVAMTPHPNVNDADAKMMVAYILSIK